MKLHNHASSRTHAQFTRLQCYHELIIFINIRELNRNIASVNQFVQSPSIASFLTETETYPYEKLAISISPITFLIPLSFPKQVSLFLS